jgi:gamma-glutamyltranspeptidase/glutathione hydrolase
LIKFYRILLFCLVFFKISCSQTIDSDNKFDSKAMVVSAHPLASEIGINILKNGGNAADATIAVQFALAVVYPSAGNIGGGGFFVYRSTDGNFSTLDFREKAPLLATRDMYLDSNNKVVKDLSLYSHLAVGVPGTVDGMISIHKKFGQLPWEDLVQPAIDLATNGFELTRLEANKLNRFNKTNGRINKNSDYFKENYSKGDSISLPQLSKTLSLIRDHKRAGFYSGKTAKMLVKEMSLNGGKITQQDLDSYQSIWRDPIIGFYKGYKIISMSPPSSGGILLIQMLKMAEHFPLQDFGFHSLKSIHVMTEIEKLSFADRAKHLGDPDFYKVPEKLLIDSLYLLERINKINMDSSLLSSNIYAGEFNLKESEETTHFSIVDKYGNASSLTTTLNGSFGSGIIVDGAGFLLNNEMDDFSIQPGHANMYGLVGGEANSVEPTKRMLSSMTPTILEKDGNLFMVLGTPGGSTIITAVFQTIINIIDFDMSIEQAVNSPRFHHQWYPDEIKLESDIAKDSNLIFQLKAMNHNLNFVSSMNRVDAILVKKNKYFGGADNRGDDHVSYF